MPVYWDPGRKRYMVRVWKDGRRHNRKLPPGATKAEADLEDARLRIELDARPRGAAREVPAFSTFCLQYGVHAEALLAEETWRGRRLQVDMLSRHLGDYLLTEITSDVVEKFVTTRRGDVRELRDDDGNVVRIKPAPGPAKIRDDLKVLRAILGYALDRGQIPAIPDFKKAVRSLRVEGRQRRVVAWTRKQIEALLAACETVSPGILGLVLFLVNTGCRKTEAIRVKSASVDLEAGVVWVEPSTDWRPKSGKARPVPISPALRRWLTRDRLRAEYVFTGPRPPGKKGAEGPPRPWQFWPQLQFDRARKKAGLKGGPHTLRHTYASEFLAAGGSMWELAQILGHSEQRTTALYSHFRPDQVAAAARRVSIGSAMGPAKAEALARGWAVSGRNRPPAAPPAQVSSAKKKAPKP
jgi:integrase